MNETLVQIDPVEILEELSTEIERLRDCAVEDAEVMASNVLGNAYGSTYLVGLADGGRRAVYWWSFTPGFASISPFDIQGVDAESGIQIWRDADEETNDDIKQWLSTLTDGFEWLHPAFRDA